MQNNELDKNQEYTFYASVSVKYVKYSPESPLGKAFAKDKTKDEGRWMIKNPNTDQWEVLKNLELLEGL